MILPEMMRVARLHDVSSPLVVEQVPVPSIAEDDILIRVRSCGIVPNLQNIIRKYRDEFPFLPLAPLPTVFGLDPAGEVVKVGMNVKEVQVGDRVYVNPMRSCDSCHRCHSGNRTLCDYATFNGYFGFSANSAEIHQRYPMGGFAEYQVAPAYAATRIPDRVSFDEAARFGYIGTAYGGLRRADFSPGAALLVSGVSGTLGVGAVVSALAMGAKRILGIARNRQLLQEIKAIAPDRIEVWSTLDGPPHDWVRAHTNGEGAEVAIDCLPTGSPYDLFLDCLSLVAPGGAMVNVGGIIADVPITIYKLMHKGVRLIGSCWFEPAHTREMAALAETGTLDLSIFDHKTFGLDQIDFALSQIDPSRGGIANYVIHP